MTNFDILARRRLQLGDQGGDVPDALHLLDVFGFKLHAEFFFNGQNEIEVLHGIPVLDGLWRRLGRDLAGWNPEDIAGYGPDLFKCVGSQFFSPTEVSVGMFNIGVFRIGTFSLIHSGQRRVEVFRSRVQREPVASDSSRTKLCCS